jgi:hypothetical protein
MIISRLSVLAELRVRSENVGATVAIEKFSWKRVKQGISAPSTIILAFIFGFNNVTVQYVVRMSHRLQADNVLRTSRGVAFFTPVCSSLRSL